MPAPEAPVPRALDPDPAAAAGAVDPVERLDPDPDPQRERTDTDRLRAVLGTREPWGDRLGDLLAAARFGLSPTRAAVVAILAAGLGIAAFVVLGSGRVAPVDPAQILPQRQAAGNEPSAAASASVGGSTRTSLEPAPAPPGTAPGTVRSSILVHAAGAVAEPGIHQVAADARVADLVVAAGGLAADADPDRINLAAPLRDGERIYVPRRGELVAPDVVAGRPDPAATAGPGGATSSNPDRPAEPVDLNTADTAALEALPGIGPTTAAAIIGHRAEHGPFSSVDELQEVAGIGPAKLAQLRDLVRV